MQLYNISFRRDFVESVVLYALYKNTKAVKLADVYQIFQYTNDGTPFMVCSVGRRHAPP